MSDFVIEVNDKLPSKTLRAPFFVARDLKKQMHGNSEIKILHDSPDSVIYVSSDLMSAIESYLDANDGECRN